MPIKECFTVDKLLDHLTDVSRAYNVGYALGLTEYDIDHLPESEFQRLIPLAKEVVAGDRSTDQHRTLALHMGIARYAAGDPLAFASGPRAEEAALETAVSL